MTSIDGDMAGLVSNQAKEMDRLREEENLFARSRGFFSFPVTTL